MHATTVALCTIDRVFFYLYFGWIIANLKQTGLNFAEKFKPFPEQEKTGLSQSQIRLYVLRLKI